MSTWALGELFVINLKSHDWGLLIATILLVIIAGLMVVQASIRIMTLRNDQATIEDQQEKAETFFKYNLKKQLILEDFFNLGKGDNLPVLPFIEKIEDYENIRILRLKGAIDMSTIPEFSKMIPEDAREEEKAINKNILLDFKKVKNVDSATIAILLIALNSLKNEKRKLVLTNVPEDLKGMLNIAEIKNLFSIYDSEDKAYKDLKEEG